MDVQYLGLGPGPVCIASTTTLADGASRVVSVLVIYVRLTITPHHIILRKPIKMRGTKRWHAKQKRDGR